jgi:hypothetical protein
MNRIRQNCIDCGSEAIKTVVDEVKPVFRIEVIHFECGAELKTSFTANGNVGKASHMGCGRG